MVFFSPIDEFEIQPVFIFQYCFLPINATFFLFLFFLLIFFRVISQYHRVFPRFFIETFLESFYLFINRLLIQNYKLNAQISVFFPFLFFLFFIILFINLFGIIPMGFTNTAFILHNFLITASIILGITLMGFLSLVFKLILVFFF